MSASNKKKIPYYDNIEEASISNKAYRAVVYTDTNIQVVLMTLKPKVSIGMEIHEDTTQFFRVERGGGLAMINGRGYILTDGVALVVPPGAKHNIINTSSSEDLHLYTIYSPPHHPPGTLQLNKE